MKIIQAEFLEAIASPVSGNGAGTQDKFKHAEGGKLSCRAFGPGLLIETTDGGKRCTVVPWANVRFAVVEMDESDSKKAKP